MKYLKLITVSAMIVLGTQISVAQNYGDQAKKAGKEKGKELKAKGQAKGSELKGKAKEKGNEKVADLKEKGQNKIDGAKAKGEGKVDGMKDKMNEKTGNIGGNAISSSSSKLSNVKNMKFDNKDGLTGAALGQARTNFAKEKATSSVSGINSMNSKVTSGQAKIDAAKQRLEEAKALKGKEALTPEEISSKQAKIDAAQQSLNGFKGSVSSGASKAKAVQAKINTY